jgi:hypothetical protein
MTEEGATSTDRLNAGYQGVIGVASGVASAFNPVIGMAISGGGAAL